MRALLAIAVCACGTRESTPPAAVTPPPTTIVRDSIAAGDRHACAVAATGKVVCWGPGGGGRSGTPDELDHLVPVEVPGLADVAGLAAGTDFTCAWTAAGAAYCWGGDDDDHRTGDHRPRRVPHAGDVVQMVAGLFGACGLRASGRVTCWPRAAWRDPLWPRVEDREGISDAIEIAGDDMHLCARLRSGEVTCSFAPHISQVEQFAVVPELAGATSIGGNSDQFAALLPGGRLASWNIADFEGRRDRPRAVYTIRGIDGERAVVGRRDICVLGARARCWKSDDLDPPVGDAVSSAQPLAAGVRDLAHGRDVQCQRVADRAECEGEVGLLGDGTAALPGDFVRVTGLADATQLVAGSRMCALRASGGVACWGPRGVRATTIDDEPLAMPGASDAVELAVSHSFVCARRRTGATCWSAEREGGAIQTHDMPALAPAVRLYSGPEVCGVSATGAVACTKAPGHGWHPPDLEAQLGAALAAGKPLCASHDGTEQCFHRTEEVVAVHGGEYALRADGTVEVRAGTPGEPRAPVERLANVVELQSNSHALCARMRDGTVACWGERDHLGAGQRTARTAPAIVAGLVMGAPRAVVPAAPVPEPIAHARGEPVSLEARALRGPYANAKAACVAQGCPGREREHHCAAQAAAYDPVQVMASPPAPLSEVRLVSFDCRHPDNRVDNFHRMRLMMTRADGVWLSAPLFAVGLPGQQCGVVIEPRWKQRAVATEADVVMSVVAGTSCIDSTGGDDEEVAMIVVAGSAKRPFVFAPIATGVHHAHGCAVGVWGCIPGERTTRLVATFANDVLALDGPATWLAIRRDASGAILGLASSATEPSAVGAYRFTR